jgi:hypothetical protein
MHLNAGIRELGNRATATQHLIVSVSGYHRSPIAHHS